MSFFPIRRNETQVRGVWHLLVRGGGVLHGVQEQYVRRSKPRRHRARFRVLAVLSGEGIRLVHSFPQRANLCRLWPYLPIQVRVGHFLWGVPVMRPKCLVCGVSLREKDTVVAAQHETGAKGLVCGPCFVRDLGRAGKNEIFVIGARFCRRCHQERPQGATRCRPCDYWFLP